MKRLYSYFVYIGVLAPIASVTVIVWDRLDPISTMASNIIDVFILTLLSYWIFLVSRSKRVYYKDSSLYIYSLFSSKFFVLTKGDIGGIFKLSLFSGFYKIVYYDNNNAKIIYFTQNQWLSDFSDIIDELSWK